MGEHKGFRTYKRGGSWVGAAWDPATQKYKTKTFGPKEEARVWARDQAAKFATRVDHLGTLKTRSLSTDFQADLLRRGKSASHRADVARVLSSYAQAVPDMLAPRARVMTETWLAGLTDLAAATRNRYLATVRAMANWAARRDLLPRNPLTAVEREKVPSFLKEQFTYEELVHLTCADGDPYHLRWCALIYLGLRITEPLSMTFEKIDREGRMAAVTGKGNKERLVPLPDEFLALLPAGRTGKVFGDVRANRYREFLGFLARQGIEKRGRSPHSTRHTYAGLMTASGVPSALLQAYMGHVSSATTSHYAKMATRYVSVAAKWQRGQLRLRSSPLGVRANGT